MTVVSGLGEKQAESMRREKRTEEHEIGHVDDAGEEISELTRGNDQLKQLSTDTGCIKHAAAELAEAAMISVRKDLIWAYPEENET
jgi:hypothetical protein